jgi:hypothetical protein
MYVNFLIKFITSYWIVSDEGLRMEEETMSAMQEIRTLAGMFQQILHNCKVRLSYFTFPIFIASKVQIIN